MSASDLPLERPEAGETDEADIVDEAEKESFPASDPPARTVVTGIPDRPLEPND